MSAVREEQKSLDSVDAQLANDDYGHAERVRLRDAEHRLGVLGNAQDVRRDLDQVRKRIATTETSLRGEQDLHRRQAAIAEQVRTSALAATELVPLQQRLAEVEQQLTQEHYGEIERAASAKLLAEIKALGYTRAEHELLRQDRQNLQQWTQQHAELERAQTSLPDMQSALRRNRELAERRNADLHKEREEATTLDVQLQGRPATELKLGDTERSSAGDEGSAVAGASGAWPHRSRCAPVRAGDGTAWWLSGAVCKDGGAAWHLRGIGAGIRQEGHPGDADRDRDSRTGARGQRTAGAHDRQPDEPALRDAARQQEGRYGRNAGDQDFG